MPSLPFGTLFRKGKNDMEPYDAVIDMFTTATQALGEMGVSKQELLPALLDFTAAVALILAGEEGLEASTQRMADRLDDWRNGTFPDRGIVRR